MQILQINFSSLPLRMGEYIFLNSQTCLRMLGHKIREIWVGCQLRPKVKYPARLASSIRARPMTKVSLSVETMWSNLCGTSNTHVEHLCESSESLSQILFAEPTWVGGVLRNTSTLISLPSTEPVMRRQVECYGTPVLSLRWRSSIIPKWFLSEPLINNHKHSLVCIYYLCMYQQNAMYFNEDCILPTHLIIEVLFQMRRKVPHGRSVKTFIMNLAPSLDPVDPPVSLQEASLGWLALPGLPGLGSRSLAPGFPPTI